MPLRIETQTIKSLERGLIVSPYGPLRASTAEEFREQVGAILETGDVQHLVIDFGRVDSIDSSTAGFLLNVHDRLGDGHLALAELTPSVRIVIDSIGLMTFFTVCNTIDEAINEIR
ncbi:MAG: STAS domain-containing protein [Planctomycetes bacterium]|nr:STAS domain-containing protein [Planctomycetota bacterium]